VLIGDVFLLDASPGTAFEVTDKINAAAEKWASEKVRVAVEQKDKEIVELRTRAEHAEGQLAATYIEIDKMTEKLRVDIAAEAEAKP
jgi:hypothetical protein